MSNNEELIKQWTASGWEDAKEIIGWYEAGWKAPKIALTYRRDFKDPRKALALKDVFDRIVNCRNINRAWESEAHPCHNIVNYQKSQLPGLTLEKFQIPEPWNGAVLDAPIIFVGINPSYTKDELHPDSTWPEEEKYIFFAKRFDSKYTDKNMGPRLQSSDNAPKYRKASKYWINLRSLSGQMLVNVSAGGIFPSFSRS